MNDSVIAMLALAFVAFCFPVVFRKKHQLDIEVAPLSKMLRPRSACCKAKPFDGFVVGSGNDTIGYCSKCGQRTNFPLVALDTRLQGQPRLN